MPSGKVVSSPPCYKTSTTEEAAKHHHKPLGVFLTQFFEAGFLHTGLVCAVLFECFF